jgi:predicted O-linked N-acetylglucosamine transferase (SPINDLY family)
MYRSGSVNPTAWENLKQLVRQPDPRINAFHNVSDVFFGATYLDSDNDHLVRRMVNQTIKAKTIAAAPPIENRPKPRHLAVATSLWFPGHSVYRILADFIDSLRDEYELTLIHLGPIRDNIDIGPFHHMKYVGFHDGKLNIESIRRNNFAMLIFPDVGMSTESIFLANLRLAPIQICGLGQSVSTYATEIDYYISGTDVERVDLAAENYSERLVLLPGFGCVHKRPEYQLRHPQRTEQRFIVNCSWYPQKVNYPLLELLSEIDDRTSKELLFRIYVGGGLSRKNDHLPFVQDVEAVLGRDNVQIVAGREYEDYMAMMEEGDLNIDSYPFGGCNVIVDALHLRKPTVTYEGTKWYNRIGSQMLRAAGVPELIATNDEQYVALVTRMIDDDDYRQEMAARIRAVDLDATVYSREAEPYFKRAIEQLLTRHEEYQHDETRAPIYVTKGQPVAAPTPPAAKDAPPARARSKRAAPRKNGKA